MPSPTRPIILVALTALALPQLSCSQPPAVEDVAARSAAAPTAAQSSDWSQWRGNDRDGHAGSFVPPATWPDTLSAAWTVEIEPGHSGPIVAEETIFLHLRTSSGEAVEARKLSDGSVLWRSEYPTAYTVHPEAEWHDRGPFSTPLYAGGVLYTMGVAEVLSAWEAESGELLWRTDFGEEFETPFAYYGTSNSPILASGHLVVHVGGPGDGALVGLDPSTGFEAWRWAGDGPAYGSAIETELDGVNQLVTFSQKQLIAVAPESGELLWELPYEVPWDNTVQTPLVVDDKVILAAWDTPARSYRPTRREEGWQVPVVWTNPDASVAYASSVLIDGSVWGFAQKAKGRLCQLDASTGETLWQGPGRQGEHATLVAAGSWLLVFLESGQLQIIDTTTEPPAPVAEYTVGESAVWAHPAVFGNSLLVKDQESLTLWRLPN